MYPQSMRVRVAPLGCLNLKLVGSTSASLVTVVIFISCSLSTIILAKMIEHDGAAIFEYPKPAYVLRYVSLLLK